MGYKRGFRKLIGAGLTAAVSMSFLAAAYGATYVPESLRNQVGPGSSSSSSYASPDGADYADTGGTAQGTMSIDSSIPAGTINAMSLEPSGSIVEVKDLYGYDDMVSDLKEMHSKYPSFMKYAAIAVTADDRRVYEATIGNIRASTHILITGATHAREYITTLLIMRQMEYILECAGNGCFDGRSVKSWLDDVCIHFIPMVNPDGVTISQYGIDALRNDSLKDLVRQAYANDIAAGYTSLDFASYQRRWKANANGVNLNDNFDANTSYINITMNQVSADHYYGSPGSEPEVRALQTIVDSTHFKAVINYHSTGSVIYWTEMGDPLLEHSRDLSNNIMALSGYTKISLGYEGGSFMAYLHTRTQPVTNLTIEVGAGTAPVSIGEFPTIWAQQKFVPFYTMKWAKEKGK